jgi:hypothetical protein
VNAHKLITFGTIMYTMDRKAKIKNHWRNIIFAVFLIAWIILFFMGAYRYQGSWYIYALFSLTYLALLISGIFKKITYGYVFLSVILWLGFWLKLVIHLLLEYPFVEPIGLFKDSESNWDSVLFVASLGAIGVMSARAITSAFFNFKPTMVENQPCIPPSWYKRYRYFLWCALAVAILFFAIVNIIYSFQQVGIVPKTIAWPLNTIFYWLLSTGFAMSTFTLLWWELSSETKNINTIYFLLLEAMASSISLLSRGLYIFHVTPLYYSLFLNRKYLKLASLKWISALLCTTFVIYIFCFPLINSIRNYHYSDVALTMPWSQISSWSEERSLIVFGIKKFALFSVDRWVGLEGLMATSAYPEKSAAFFLSAATEKAEIGKASIFQEVALSHYRNMDLTKFAFASLPGPISFFYLADSLWVVVLGMIIVTLLLLFAELFAFKLLPNPLFSALWGSILATGVSQMGINIPGLFYYYFLCTIGILTLHLFHRSFYIRGIKSLRARGI